MSDKNGPSVVAGEVEGIFNFIMKQAKFLRSRKITLSHEELAPFLIGDTTWKVDINPEQVKKSIERRKNRIRYKITRKLVEMGLENVRFINQGSGYEFTISPSVVLDIDHQETTQTYEELKKTNTFSEFFTPFKAPHYFPDLVTAMKRRRRILLIGPKGCGKDRSLEEAAAFLGLEQQRIALGQINDPSDLFGTKEVGVDKETGSPVTKYVHGLFTEAAVSGKVLILDELDSVQAQVALALNMALECQGKIHCPTENGTVWITPHENFIVCATANTWGYGDNSGMYAGTEMQNRATWDRFGLKIQCDYDPKIEKELVSNYLHPNVVEALYNQTESFTQKIGVIIAIREAIKNKEINDHLSFRTILEFARYFNDHGWHKGMYYLLMDINPNYRQKVIDIITKCLGNQFRPSCNDYQSGDGIVDYIPKMEEQIRQMPNRAGEGFVSKK